MDRAGLEEDVLVQLGGVGLDRLQLLHLGGALLDVVGLGLDLARLLQALDERLVLPACDLMGKRTVGEN